MYPEPSIERAEPLSSATTTGSSTLELRHEVLGVIDYQGFSLALTSPPYLPTLVGLLPWAAVSAPQNEHGPPKT